MAQLPASEQSSADTCAQLDGGEVEADFASLHPGTKSYRDKDQLPGRTAQLRAGVYRRPFLGSLKSLLNHWWKLIMSVLDMCGGSVCPRAAYSPRQTRQPLVSAT